MSASFVDVASGRPGEEVAYRGRIDHMDVVTDSLTIALLRSLSRTQTVGVTRGSLAGAKSLPALKALLESEQAFRRGAWDSAQKAAEEAIRLDSTFALAYYWARLFGRVGSQHHDSLSDYYSDQAQIYNHGLSPRDSLLIASNAELENYKYWQFRPSRRCSRSPRPGSNAIPTIRRSGTTWARSANTLVLDHMSGVTPRAFSSVCAGDRARFELCVLLCPRHFAGVRGYGP